MSMESEDFRKEAEDFLDAKRERREKWGERTQQTIPEEIEYMIRSYETTLKANKDGHRMNNAMTNQEVDKLAKILWDYHHLNHELQSADCLMVFGSNDLRIAEYGVELFLKGFAPLIIFSGGAGRFTKKIWEEPEAEKFARVAIQRGVPKEKIFIENRSSNTGENILFTKDLLNTYNLHPQTFILVHKPYMERRTYATFKKHVPEKECIVTSPPLSFENYPNQLFTKEDIINILVGDLQRIKLYAERGFQIPQEIPTYVLDAYNKLIKLGYTRQLIS